MAPNMFLAHYVQVCSKYPTFVYMDEGLIYFWVPRGVLEIKFLWILANSNQFIQNVSFSFDILRFLMPKLILRSELEIFLFLAAIVGIKAAFDLIIDTQQWCIQI